MVDAVHENVRALLLIMLLILLAGAVNDGQLGETLLTVIVNPVAGVAPFAEW